MMQSMSASSDPSTSDSLKRKRQPGDSDEDEDNASSEPNDDMHPKEVLEVLTLLYDELYTLEKSPPQQQIQEKAQPTGLSTWRRFQTRATVHDTAAEELIRHNIVPKLKNLMGRPTRGFSWVSKRPIEYDLLGLLKYFANKRRDPRSKKEGRKMQFILNHEEIYAIIVKHWNSSVAVRPAEEQAEDLSEDELDEIGSGAITPTKPASDTGNSPSVALDAEEAEFIAPSLSGAVTDYTGNTELDRTAYLAYTGSGPPAQWGEDPDWMTNFERWFQTVYSIDPFSNDGNTEHAKHLEEATPDGPTA